MRKKNPLFSVIVPTYNRSSLLKFAIQSVLNQSFQGWELIIIDDGSIDDTRETVAGIGDSRIKYYYQEHSEKSIARNWGITKATGDYICFLDDDDYFLDPYLSDFYNYLREEGFPKLILRTGFIQKTNKREKKSINYNAQKHRNPINFAAYYMCGVWSLCIPSIYLIEDQFPANFPHWQDTHLILRIISKYPFHQLNNHNYVYRIHDKMGSIYAKRGENILQRALINTEAINHFFNNYNNLVQEYLPKDTYQFLITEKYLQYAIDDIIYNNGVNLKFFASKVKFVFRKRIIKYIMILIKVFIQKKILHK